MMFVAVEDADTAVTNAGTYPNALVNDNTEPSIVLNTNVPIPPTYNPPATNPNCGVVNDALTKVEPDVGVTAAPPENCPFSTKFC
jgi:hypothetical protein